MSNAAQRDLRRIRDRTILQRVSRAIGGLAHDPHPPGARKLRDVGGIWRIRTGGWRICYTVEADRLIVLILTVAQRGDVYERLRRRLE